MRQNISRLEARWAVFFNNIGFEYEYEMEDFDMEECSYLPDFYIPSIDRWFEIKGQPLTVSEVQKCEQFCRRKDNENIKFSILIGAPKPLMLEEEDFSILGIREYTWQWLSQMYPSDTLLLAQGLTREEYYSRFLPAIWKVDDEAAAIVRQIFAWCIKKIERRMLIGLSEWQRNICIWKS